jgi:cellobiose-specific phosphotransferase system component IIB
MNKKLVILKCTYPVGISASQTQEVLKYYLEKILVDLNDNTDNTEFKMIVIPSEKYEVTVIYPNVAITKKELNKILDEQNKNVKLLNNLDNITRDKPEINRNIKQILRRLKILEISDF